MASQASELIELVEKFEDTPMVVVGDLILDYYIWGRVDRISPEAPVVVVETTEENKRLGGAGNVANNIASLGAMVSLCGVVGEDNNGKAIAEMIEQEGGSAEGVLVDRSRRTTVKTRVIAHAQQVVRVDREDRHPLESDLSKKMAVAVKNSLSSAKGVIVSDYAKGAIGKEIFDVFQEGYSQGQLGLGKLPVIVDPKGPNFDIYKNATIIKPNRGEAEQASGVKISSRQDALKAADVLLERWGCEAILITLGDLGMVLVGKDGGHFEVDTVAREVYDVSGAGDTVSAVFALSLAAGAEPYQAAELANLSAGVVVGEVGTVAITKDQLIRAIQERR